MIVSFWLLLVGAIVPRGVVVDAAYFQPVMKRADSLDMAVMKPRKATSGVDVKEKATLRIESREVIRTRQQIRHWTKEAEKTEAAWERYLERERKKTEIASMISTGTTGDYQMYAYSFFENYGWTENDFQCLIALWNRESRWNPNAHNGSSGAHGIPQSLPAGKMASEGADYYTNGYTQIRWGIKYIARRYGTPSAAWAHSQQYGWY